MSTKQVSLVACIGALLCVVPTVRAQEEAGHGQAQQEAERKRAWEEAERERVQQEAERQRAQQEVEREKAHLPEKQRVSRVVPAQDPLLSKVDQSERSFTRLENTELKFVSYFHRRRIGEAIVEKDFIRYLFDSETGELIEQTRHWRDDLPDRVAPVIGKQEAESMVEGTVEASDLYIISPDSEVVRIEPTPKNPCWVIYSWVGEGLIITIIDAMTGEKLGNGVPPPYEGLSIHGPHWGACPQSAIWYNHAQNAHNWYETIGYDTIRVGNASEATIRSHVQSDTTVMFYELDHGGSTSFHNRCDQDLAATEIETWITNYSTMGFSFIGSCGGLCSTGEDTFATEFRKGSNFDSVVVGYCGMDSAACADCWPDAIAWQTELFRRMDQGYSVSTAYAYANGYSPDCADDGHLCMRTAGDTSLVFGGSTYPKVRRSICSSSLHDVLVIFTYISPLLPVTSTANTRAHHIRCNATVGSGRQLTISANSSYPYNEVAFAAGAKLTVQPTGIMRINTGNGLRVSLVSEQDNHRGLYVKPGGEIVVHGGGEIRTTE